jgi:hypothetical protein
MVTRDMRSKAKPIAVVGVVVYWVWRTQAVIGCFSFFSSASS